MAAETFLFDGRTVYFRLPQTRTETTPAVFLLTGGDPSQLMEQAAASLKKLSPGAEPLFICMPPDRWNLDFSPWPAPALNETDDPFEGGADDYLRLLTEEIIPKVEKEITGTPRWRGIVGYSLAGLFALYAIYRTDLFSRVGSMSGSLWFPGMKDYIFSHEPKRQPDHMYFSLGDKESKTRNPVLRSVRQNTEEIQTFYQSKGINTVFELNPGNHYNHAAERTAAGIVWLLNR